MVKEKLEIERPRGIKSEYERPKGIKEKSEVERPKEIKEDAVKVFMGKDVTVILRGGTKLKGKLEIATRYELVLTVDNKPTIIMKHAVDYITLSENIA